MRTPYDTALRVMGREIDALRSAIGGAVVQLGAVEAMHDGLSAAIAREAALAAGDWRLVTDGYRLRAWAERERLAAERRAAQARLDTLRRKAAELYGSLRTVEGAAETFRSDADRAVVAAEQAASDDVAGARFARDLRLARAARAQGDAR